MPLTNEGDSMTTITSQRFLVGTVISQTFTAFFSKLLPFAGFALIGFIPSMIFLGAYFYFVFYIVGFSGFPGIDESGQPFDPRAVDDLPWGWIVAALVANTIASIATTAIWLAATSYGTFQYLRGQPVSFWASLRRGVSVALPCIGATFLISLVLLLVGAIIAVPLFVLIDQFEAGTAGVLLSIFIGFLAVIFVLVAVAFIICRMWVAIPTIAVERPGVLAALRRSWELTRGQALRVFGIILVMWAGTIGASVAAGIVVFIAILSIGGITGIVVGQGVNILISLLANALYAIAAAVSYVELRRAKEGFGIEDIAAVFD
jgi:hypothetical protein